MIQAWFALALLVAYGVLSFGLRSWLHWRRTGSTGFRGISGAPGSAEWWGGILLVVAILLAVAAPASVLAGYAAPSMDGWPVGAVLLLLGIGGTLAAQLTMGDSWRIGVDEREQTVLVSRGLFRVSRNPIFSSTLIFLAGLALAVPTATALLAFAAAFAGLELQVRLVEEPYLLRTHREAYAQYAAEVGRFLPWLGRIRTS